ncbi:Leucine-rich repeat-containing protein sog2 [Zalerion maritima]|uniref:Leucine-rich repeat-containing protein sog2 n=1 Tax=Zalerion maritima TaxID=339359 RepID=A0AAD5RZQ6_9PEZI|nr:Leucine-rich repeat-containing protein sog2 [Zalerion maritima]
MDRDRSGSQPPLRGLPENPAQGRRQQQLQQQQIPPVPSLRNVPHMPSISNSTLSATPPMPATQVVSIVKEAMENALEQHRTQAGEASDLVTGVTIDLSRKSIQKLPDEVVDIIKTELERLALSHNNLSSFPMRFSECTSLRYLNVRYNQIREFPLPLCDLKSLEILDLCKNKLSVLPPEIAKLTSLKVLSIQKNRIEELPLCLGDMASLQMLKLDGNPVKFPPREVFEVQATTPPNQGQLNENEVNEVGVTAHIKKFLRQVSHERSLASNGRVDSDIGGDESSEGPETPRVPLKRVTSGRFPVKPSGTDIPDLRSPSLSRPPPIPTRSHYRGLSQQSSGGNNNHNGSGTMRKPGVMPLTISGSINERVRSNSETLLQARSDRPESRQRRLLAMSKKAADLGTLDETQANNRFSHYRGLSHGSAMQGNGVGAVQSPASPAEPALHRPIYVRRLSVLPERRRESRVADPVIEMARGLLYAVFQTHPMIQNLLGVFSDGHKRSSIEIVLFNTNSHVEELEQEIIRHDEEDPSAPRENDTVMHACQTVLGAYVHVCGLLLQNVDSLVENGDPRYIRTLFTCLNHSTMELRAAMTSQLDVGFRRAATRAAYGDTLRPHSRENSATPTADRPGSRTRSRQGTFVHNPSNLRVATDVPLPPQINGTGRTATITSATPRSGESFTSSISGRGLVPDFTEQDRLFERVFLSLQRSSEKVMLTLPHFNSQFLNGYKMASGQRYAEAHIRLWKVLYDRCQIMLNTTDALKMYLSSIKLKDPEVRNQARFWGICRDFIEAWTDLVGKIKDSVQHYEGDKLPHIAIAVGLLSPIFELATLPPASWPHAIASNDATECSAGPRGTGHCSIDTAERIFQHVGQRIRKGRHAHLDGWAIDRPPQRDDDVECQRQLSYILDVDEFDKFHELDDERRLDDPLFDAEPRARRATGFF